MNAPVIREATHADALEIEALCRAIDPKDYVPEAWAAWMAEGDAINLVAEAGNRIVGCAHGRVLVFPDGWSQAVRVHPEMRRARIGLSLMASIEKEFLRRGITAIFGNIGTFNAPSLTFFTQQGWKIVCTIKRRRATRRIESPLRNSPSVREELAELVKIFPVLASLERAAYFSRVYFSMNEDFLEKAITSKSVRVAPEANAFALLDPGEGNPKRIWVTALAGSIDGMKQLIEGFLAEASALGADLIIDGPDDPELQAFMDGYGFAPPQRNGAYYVVKKELANQ